MRRPRPKPRRALAAVERQIVLDLLRAPRFADQAPAEIYVCLLDEGVYHCSIRTMYRVLAASQEVRERRKQLPRRSRRCVRSSGGGAIRTHALPCLVETDVQQRVVRRFVVIHPLWRADQTLLSRLGATAAGVATRSIDTFDLERRPLCALEMVEGGRRHRPFRPTAAISANGPH